MSPRIVYFVVYSSLEGTTVIIQHTAHENYSKTEWELNRLKMENPNMADNYYIDSIEFIPEN